MSKVAKDGEGKEGISIDGSQWNPFSDNLDTFREGDILFTRTDLSRISYQTEPKLNKYGTPSTGSDMRCSSHGNKDIGGGIKMNVNIMSARTDKESLEAQAKLRAEASA